MYETILIPTDGSDTAREAAEHAIDLAADSGATVHVLYVIESKPVFTVVGFSGLEDDTAEEEYRAFAEERLAEIKELAEERGVEAKTVIKRGTPHTKIVEYADDIGADTIVMGAHGYDWDGIEQRVLGSTTERVNRNSLIPVVTVR